MKGITDWILLVACFVLGGLIAALIATSQPAEVVYANNTINNTVYVPVQANSTVQDAAANLILKDENFKKVALDLATAKLNNDDIYNALVAGNVSIWDAEDITSYVIDDSEVSNIDADDKDANVTLNLIVRYEDASGENHKSKVDVTALVRDGKLKDSNVEYVLVE